MQSFNPSTWEAEVGKSLWGWGQSGLQSEFQNSQGYTDKPCLKKQKQTKSTTLKLDMEAYAFIPSTQKVEAWDLYVHEFQDYIANYRPDIVIY